MRLALAALIAGLSLWSTPASADAGDLAAGVQATVVTIENGYMAGAQLELGFADWLAMRAGLGFLDFGTLALAPSAELVALADFLTWVPMFSVGGGIAATSESTTGYTTLALGLRRYWDIDWYTDAAVRVLFLDGTTGYGVTLGIWYLVD